MTANVSQSKLLRSLLGYAIRHQPAIVPITILGVVSSVLELAAMTLIIPLSTLAGGQRLRAGSVWAHLPQAMGLAADAKFFVLAFLGLLLLRTLTMAAAQIFNQYTMRQLIAHFSSRALDSFVHHLSFQEVQKHQVGHFLTLAGDEANRGAQIVNSLMKLVPFLALFLLYVAALFYYSWQVGAALFGFSLLALWLLKGAFRKSHALGHRQQLESRALSTHFIDSLSSLRTVRSFNAEQFVSSRYQKMIGNYAWTCFAIDALNALAANAPAVLMMGALLAGALILADAAWLSNNMAVLLASTVMILRLLPLANQALDAAMRLTADLKAAQNVFDMLVATKAQVTPGAAPQNQLQEPIRRIEFDNVSFRYSSDLPKVLEGFSLTLESGRSYALTGSSGSGKSSLVDLLLKFYTPGSGVIRINGRDISGISDASLRDHIILSEQAARLFYDTVLHNVQFGHPYSPEEVWKALDMVGLEPFMKSLPQRIDTLLDYQGSNFSGGQRQRVALARALLRAADVLILDESTNALDATTREQVITKLRAAYRDKILLFVTHDAWVIKNVDQVIQLHPSSAQTEYEDEPAAVIG